MNHSNSPISHSRRWRRWIPTATAIGAGGTALVIWFEEIFAIAAEFIGVIFLPILAGIIYLFNHLVFRSAMPRREDMQSTQNKRADQ